MNIRKIWNVQNETNENYIIISLLKNKSSSDLEKLMWTLNLNLIPLTIKKLPLMYLSFIRTNTRERACKMEWKDNLEFQWQIHKLKSKTVELSWIHRSTAHECMFYAHHFLFPLGSILYLMHSQKEVLLLANKKMSIKWIERYIDDGWQG